MTGLKVDLPLLNKKNDFLKTTANILITPNYLLTINLINK